MPRISEEIILNCSREKAFNEISKADFMKEIDPAALNTEILFRNERLIHTISRGTPSGDVELEMVIIPENFTIVLMRRPPLTPFVYQLSIKTFSEHKDGTLLKHINEFELADNFKPGEEMVLSVIKQNDILNLQRTKDYFNNSK